MSNSKKERRHPLSKLLTPKDHLTGDGECDQLRRYISILIGGGFLTALLGKSCLTLAHAEQEESSLVPEIIWSSDALYPAISPDKKTVAFSNNLLGIFILELASGEWRLVSGVEYADHPSWSPTSTTIVYGRFVDNAYEVVTIDLETNEKAILGKNLRFPVWSPSEAKILAIRQSQQHSVLVLLTQQESGVWIEKELEHQYAGSPAWSPDGKWFAFEGSIAANPGLDIYVCDANGLNCYNLSKMEGPEYAPSWGPNGRSIVFDSKLYATTEFPRNYDLLRKPSVGGRVERLTTDPGLDAFSAISSTGRIAYLSNAGAELIVSGYPTIVTDEGPRVLVQEKVSGVLWIDAERLLLHGYRGNQLAIVRVPLDNLTFLPLVAK